MDVIVGRVFILEVIRFGVVKIAMQTIVVDKIIYSLNFAVGPASVVGSCVSLCYQCLFIIAFYVLLFIIYCMF